ncbi:MAG TPA: helix-turn-helix domain-containing protein [Acidimicrobiales bacterium]|nr:helix-turn-helix domain-containing protein [Acidimicrobiales bacterium]
MGAHEQLDLWNINEEPATRLVTVTEAGRMLSVSRSTVYELIGAGRLEVVHIGRSVRVPLDAIASYIKTLRRPVLRPVDGAPADAPA